jgi:hypothetical protein
MLFSKNLERKQKDTNDAATSGLFQPLRLIIDTVAFWASKNGFPPEFTP